MDTQWTHWFKGTLVAGKNKFIGQDGNIEWFLNTIPTPVITLWLSSEAAAWNAVSSVFGDGAVVWNG